MKFKIGDKVRCVYNDNGTREFVGDEGEISGMVRGKPSHPYLVSFSESTFSEEELELISNHKTMNLQEKFALAFKGEPEKSFIKAGVMNTDESLTQDGVALVLAFLLRKHGEEFKKDVIDPMLAEEE